MEFNCVAKRCTCFPLFSLARGVKGRKQRALSVISRSSTLSEFTVYIVRRGFAYWGISGRTGALTTGATIDWQDAKIVDPVEPHAMHNSIVILSMESLLTYPPDDSCCGATSILHTWPRFCTRLGLMVNYWISRSIRID